jgi:DNA-directed RNA polymerase specialized sigma24 family protein
VKLGVKIRLKGKAKILSPKEEEAVLNLYIMGHTTAQIRKFCGVSRHPIRDSLKRHGIREQKRKRQLSAKQEQEISELHKNGYTYRDLADQLNVSVGLIANTLKERRWLFYGRSQLQQKCRT